MNDSWQDRQVLVTGATGLIGSWLTRSLVDDGARVASFVLDGNPQTDFVRSKTIQETHVVRGNLEDYRDIDRALGQHEPDTVIHLGAQTLVGTAKRTPRRTFETNIRGTYNLLEACRRYDAVVDRVVIASSDKAYGESNNLPYTEDMRLEGRHPYEASKSCADILSQSYFETYQLPTGIARLGNVYGGGDLNWSRLVPGTVRSILAGERPVIRSDGTYVRDYLYVKDAAGAYRTLAEELDRPSVQGEAYNFGGGNRMTVTDMVEQISELAGTEDIEPKILDEADQEISEQYLSSKKARNELGWTTEYSLREGLRETIAWYEDFLEGQV